MRIRKQRLTSVAPLRKALHLLARPVKGSKGRSGIVIQPYRGFASEKKVFLVGRVFRQPGGGAGLRRGTLARDIVDFIRRALRWGVRHAVLEARFRGGIQRVRADRNGYFRVRMAPSREDIPGRLWQSMELRLLWPESSGSSAKGSVFVIPKTARFVVISDIDDTVISTGVANKVRMVWRMLLQRARKKIAFPGVAAFYRALHRGITGEARNPLLYVSRGPWAIYEILTEFFNLHNIPVGPILFLREWGLTFQQPFPPPSKDHKLNLIRTMLESYKDLPFILIGDSGQSDPEIYAQVVREHPGRVMAVYIRNVSLDPNRSKAVEELARQVVEAGSSLVLASDTFSMASHAVDHGYIHAEDLPEILGERVDQEGRTALQPTHAIEGSTPEENLEALQKGELEKRLRGAIEGEPPPNIVLESK
ncbi:MAG: DUF2183 domain-containing protein [Desulfobacteraceae bacterium]|nr:MAG: DUF2183 domain-containing protein [Desulfobacteraceae bacterium]